MMQVQEDSNLSQLSGIQENRYLIFKLGDEEYAVDLLRVKEVVAPPEITRLPFSASHLLGVMNLRGSIISTFDLRKAFGLQPNPSEDSVIVIFNIDGTRFGALVDHIESVLNIEPGRVEQNSEVAAHPQYVVGIVYHENRLITVIDIMKSLRLSQDGLTFKKAV